MVASTTAAKYGVKNTSGRIWASPQRAAVDSTRQTIAKPTESGRAGWETPCQPRRNSSINFAMDLSLHVISGTKLWPSIRQNHVFQSGNGGKRVMPAVRRRLRRFLAAEIVSQTRLIVLGKGEMVWDGWTARLR